MKLIVWLCDNELCRSSKAPDVLKVVYGSKVAVLSDEKLSIRVLVSEFKMLLMLEDAVLTSFYLSSII